MTEARGLVLERVVLGLGGRRLVELSLQIAPGEIVTLMGPSGSGKSSLLAYLCGVLDPAFSAAGAVWIAGRRIDGLPPHARRLGLLYQDDLLFPHMTVADNLAFGLPAGLRRAERRRRIGEALGVAELSGFEQRDPQTLSGGQRARVALLRTLLAEPQALLLDEPFGKLDVALRQSFRDFVFGEARRRGLPVLMVTHDPGDAAAGGRIVSLEAPSAQ